jgi:hypothetical protein
MRGCLIVPLGPSARRHLYQINSADTYETLHALDDLVRVGFVERSDSAAPSTPFGAVTLSVELATAVEPT